MTSNGFTRITIPAKGDWNLGQHYFLRFTSFGLAPRLSAHPFTVCSLPTTNPDEESELVFYLRHQKGLTAALYQHALDHPGSAVPVFVDGPYGGVNLQKYHEGDQLLVIAGGSGAGWCLPFIERFLRYGVDSADEERGQVVSTESKATTSEVKETTSSESSQGRCQSGPQSLRVILATRDLAGRTWFLQTVEDLIARYSVADPSSHISVQVHLTGDAADKMHESSKHLDDSTRSIGSMSSAGQIYVPEKGRDTTVPGKEFEGRPVLPLIIQEEATKVAEAGQALSIFVCGPTTMQSEVRNSVAAQNLKIVKGAKSGGVYLHSEHFSWA